ncbi:hypothetical protein CIPAW_09G102300 [Carya illinoinensis]|uniref:USP domain-containing protein n=1 Tax=Carya illinoinensis TaxID=32201 RepID=A0A8T1PB28_CARIL|nr:hypothetical protein CIPAW_09G102300 [Carya illinoinensis]
MKPKREHDSLLGNEEVFTSELKMRRVVEESREVERRRDCPYLDTVNCHKFRSVSLSNLNVFACLVCGKYYQGRVYCLPNGYEIDDLSLDDIRCVLSPRFTREQVEQLDKNKQWSRALDGSDYLPGMIPIFGFVGLNNIKDTDFVNVIIQSLMRVTPLRKIFLIPENYRQRKFLLIWHRRNFKGQFLQAVMKAGKKRFRIGAKSDPVEFMSWFLNTFHNDLKTKKNKSIIYDCFQGKLEVVKEMQNKAVTEKNENGDYQNFVSNFTDGGTKHEVVVTETSRMPFLMLGLDLPPPPLFKDVMEKNILPQVPLFNILKKFDGETVTEVVQPLNFPVKNLELKDYIPLPTPKESEKLRQRFYRVFVQWNSEELWYEMQELHVSETFPQMIALSEAYMQIYERQQ